MLFKLIKTYLLILLSIVSGWTMTSWLFTSYTHWVVVHDYFLPIFLMIVICVLAPYYFLVPILNEMKVPLNRISLVIIMSSFCIAFSTNTINKYFDDRSYSLTLVSSPSEIMKYPNEKFFKIRKYFVDQEKYHYKHESEIIGQYSIRASKGLRINENYVVPLFENENQTKQYPIVFYGLSFSKTFSYYNFESDQILQKAILFREESKEKFLKHDFYKVDYFEKLEEAGFAKYFKLAWNQSRYFNLESKPVFLTAHQGGLEDNFHHAFEMMVYTALFLLGFIVVVFALVDFF